MAPPPPKTASTSSSATPSNVNHIPGPRYLANGQEIARRDGELVAAITAFADRPAEMREVIAHHITNIGVDTVKLNMSGEEVVPDRPAEACYFTDEETAACVEEAHARDSVKMCVKHGVDVIYHTSWTDAEGMDMLEKNKSKLMVAPAISAVRSALYHGAPSGITYEIAEKLGYKRELDAALTVLGENASEGDCHAAVCLPLHSLPLYQKYADIRALTHDL